MTTEYIIRNGFVFDPVQAPRVIEVDATT